MHKQKDHRTYNEKIYDFMYKYKFKIILFSFLISLSIFLVSIITLNKGGMHIVIFYPLALITFVIDLLTKNGGLKYINFSFSIFAMIAAIVMFILGFFIEL